MTVEAVPRVDAEGQPIDPARLKLMHTTMQTLGRMAVVGGGLLVAIANVVMLGGLDEPSRADRIEVYLAVHELALVVPAISVAGVAVWACAITGDRSAVASAVPPSHFPPSAIVTSALRAIHRCSSGGAA